MQKKLENTAFSLLGNQNVLATKIACKADPVKFFYLKLVLVCNLVQTNIEPRETAK